MKKIMNKVSFAVVGMMTSASAFAAKAGAAKGPLKIDDGMCGLLTSLHDVFSILRIMAFVGAAFYIANWAWGYISNAGDDKKGGSVEDLKKKGVSLLLGFTLLFVIGIVLSFVMSASGLKVLGCNNILQNW
jgi:hypothetical protein